MNFNDYNFNKNSASDLFNPEETIIFRHIPFLNLTMRN
jgi:hypothetical protein